MIKKILQFRKAAEEETIPPTPEQTQASDNNEASGAEAESQKTQKKKATYSTGFEKADSVGKIDESK